MGSLYTAFGVVVGRMGDCDKMVNEVKPGWGVWCGHVNDWFNHSEGGPIHYETESEARSIATNLQLLLPANSYEARRHTPSLCCYGIQGCTKGNVIHECGKVRPEEC